MNRKYSSYFCAGELCFIILINIYACCGTVKANLKSETLELSSSETQKDKTEGILHSKESIFHKDDCDCGEHGSCRYENKIRICECEEHYREFRGECRECFCGYQGSCDFGPEGVKKCRCDYGFSLYKGICAPCDCDPWGARGIGAICTFVNDQKKCTCPEGYRETRINCEDIDECLNTSACPLSMNCVNIPGDFQCECKTGYQMKRPYEDIKNIGCEDIDECSIAGTCMDPLTECINSPGSYDCVCKTGYYSTAGTRGESYIPMYNMCYSATDLWLAATIALGTIMFFGIVTTFCYILQGSKRDTGTLSDSDMAGLRGVRDILELIRLCS
ncbi:uncharacterized protein NPIL_671661 [Nephila pilipes]|uniref:EGF-like domain-containing protein n=1 Tax=Nephila pilipes TaxID=299642 RepID=A0A8X6NU42_NEPPI|nr:uncharacterized protein NPIL_671661 [Nephila pilipes]